MIGLDAVAGFLSAMVSSGITPPANVAPDGTLHRFQVEGDRRGSRNGWFVLYEDDPPAGAFGCWKRGISETWSGKPMRSFTEVERAAWHARMQEVRCAREAEEQKAKSKAAKLWSHAEPADPQHPYLRRKCVGAHGVRQMGDRLVVPVTADGEIYGLQFIEADPGVEPGKRFLRGTCKARRYFPIGWPNGRLAIAEGYATAATVHEATRIATVVAFDAGNLLPVAEAMRARFPDIEIIIAGDNDHHNSDNPGLKAATGAAEAVGGRVIVPAFPADDPGTDWNDAAQSPGVESVVNAFSDDDREPEVRLAEYYAYLPEHKYIFVPTRALWPGVSVDARIEPVADGAELVKASKWLDRHQHVEQMTWAPGESLIVQDRLVSQGGWIEKPGCAVFNLYRPPQIEHGDPSGAAPWLEHIHQVYPGHADHLIAWLSQRVQQPGTKVNHAIVLGGDQGIGKDTLLEPVKVAVGPWNFSEVSPAQLLGRFNGFVKSVILRISEARDLGDVDRYAFYEHTKVYTAAPPDVLRCDEKNIREYAVVNVCGVVITTNYKGNGIYLPADDRRHYVAWSEASKEDFSPEYWNSLWRWYEGGGRSHVAAYLASMDLSKFDAKAPPPKTDAFWDIVDSNRAPEDAELADSLDALSHRDATTRDEIATRASASFSDWLRDRRNFRQIPHRLESAGYVPVRNDTAKSGLWVVGGKRQVIYARADLSVQDRHRAAAELAKGKR